MEFKYSKNFLIHLNILNSQVFGAFSCLHCFFSLFLKQCLIFRKTLQYILHLLGFFLFAERKCIHFIYFLRYPLKKIVSYPKTLGFPDDSDGKESSFNAGGLDSVSGLGRFPGEGNDNLGIVCNHTW